MNRSYVNCRKRAIILAFQFLALSLLFPHLHLFAQMPQLGGVMRPNYESYRLDKLITQGDASYSGDLSLSLPILTIPGRHGHDFEIKLTYNSHITQRQQASWVGLGWNLEAGAVQRSVVGRSDDQLGISYPYYLGLEDPDPDVPYRSHLPGFLAHLNAPLADSLKDQPDMYTLMVDGSSEEIIPVQGATSFDPVLDFPTFLTSSYKPWDINAIWTTGYGGPIKEFTLLKENGVSYLFGDSLFRYDQIRVEGRAQDVAYNGRWQNFRFPYRWNLSRISFPDGSSTLLEYNYWPTWFKERYQTVMIDRSNPWENNIFGAASSGWAENTDTVYFQYSTLKTIRTNTHYAIFVSDSIGGNTERHRRLKEIIVYDIATNTELKRAVFSYASDENNNNSTWNTDEKLKDNQLTLTSVQIRHGMEIEEEESLPPYQMTYQNNPIINLDTLTRRSATVPDFPGHYTDAGYFAAWTLHDLTLPTKAKITYSYEAFPILYDPEGRLATYMPWNYRSEPRVRLASRTVYDPMSGETRAWQYQYGTAVYDPPSTSAWTSYIPSFLYSTSGIPNIPDNYYRFYRGCQIGHRSVKTLGPDGSWSEVFFKSSYKAQDADPQERFPDYFYSNPTGWDTLVQSRAAVRGLVWKTRTNTSTTYNSYDTLIIQSPLIHYEYGDVWGQNNHHYKVQQSCLLPRLRMTVNEKDGVRDTLTLSYLTSFGPDHKLKSLEQSRYEYADAIRRITITSYAHQLNPEMKVLGMLSQIAGISKQQYPYQEDNYSYSSSETKWSNTFGYWLPSEDLVVNGPPFQLERIAAYVNYDTCSNVTKIIGALNDTTIYYYGTSEAPFIQAGSGASRGYVTGVRKPLVSPALRQSFRYDHFGNTIQVKDENGDSTIAKYDSLGRIQRVVGPNGKEISKFSYQYASGSNPNWIRTFQFRSSSDSTVSTNYYDGTGNERQQHTWFADKDIITASTFDNLMRPSRSYKPYQILQSMPHAFDTNYHLHAKEQYPEADSLPFSKRIYEQDPQGRVKEEFYPGSAFGTSASHHTKYHYLTNGYEISDYLPGSLRRSDRVDENGIKHSTYTNKFGMVVATISDSVGLRLTTWMDYDYMGRLIAVVSPKNYNPTAQTTWSASNAISRPEISLSILRTAISPVPKRAQVTLKTGPMFEAPPIIGDEVDQEDGATVYYKIREYAGTDSLRESPRYSLIVGYYPSGLVIKKSPLYDMLAATTKIILIVDSVRWGTSDISGIGIDLDCFSRPWSEQAAELKMTYNWRGLVTKKTTSDAGTQKFRYDQAGNLRFAQTAQQESQGKFTYNKYDRMGRIIETGEYSGTFSSADSVSSGNSVSDFPTSGNWCTKTYFDVIVGGDLTAQKLLGKPSCIVTNNAGVMDSCFYSYDEFGRVQWQLHKLAGLTARKISYKYDWQGNITELGYIDLATSQNNTYFFFEYDLAGRLAKVFSCVGNVTSPRTKEAEYTYLPNGQVKRLQLGMAQGMDYKYNERDWLTTINTQNHDPYQDPGFDGANGIPMDQFGQLLGYNSRGHITASDTNGFSFTPQYNGNVSWMVTRTNKVALPGVDAGYTDPIIGQVFNYDNNNRLLKADFGYFRKVGNSGYWSNNDIKAKMYDIPVITYDKIGNIMTMQRKGVNALTMDSLTYRYLSGTNKLEYVDDGASGASFSIDVDDQSPNNYRYDLDGNMIKDVQGGVDTIKYDYRNLPVQIKKNGVITNYRYDANGNRTYKSVAGGQTVYYITDAAGRTLAVLNSNGSIKMMNIQAGEHIGYMNVAYETAPNTTVDTTAEEDVNQEEQLIEQLLEGGEPENNPGQEVFSGENIIEEEPPGQPEPDPNAGEGPVAGPGNRIDKRYYYLKDHLGSVRAVVQAGDVMLTDDFNANLTQWTTVVGGGFVRVANRLTSYNAGENILINSSPKVLDDGIVTVDVYFDDDQSVGDPPELDGPPTSVQGAALVLRYRNTTNYYAVGFLNGSLTIYKRDSTGMNAKQSVYVPEFELPATCKLQATLEGNRIMVYWNGMFACYWDDPTPWLSGKVGFRHALTGTTHWDNITVTTGGPGKIVANDDYDAWGMVLEGRSSNAGNADARYKFTSKERDTETGYDYFGARYYDTRIGRWMSVDPLAEKYLGWSPYAYVIDNPIAHSDPNGMEVRFHISTNTPAFHKALNLYMQTAIGHEQIMRFHKDSRILVIYQIGNLLETSAETVAGQCDNFYESRNDKEFEFFGPGIGLGKRIIEKEGKALILITLDGVTLEGSTATENAERIYHEGKAHIEYDLDENDLTGTKYSKLEEHERYNKNDKSRFVKEARRARSAGPNDSARHIRYRDLLTGEDAIFAPEER